MTLTVPEAARELGLDPSTIRHQLRNGALAGTKRGRDWWIDLEELDRYRAEHLGRRGRRREKA